jgi:hypothetical protein
MRSTIIDAGSKQSDVWGLLTGTWNEYDQAGWHIVKTPFFTVLSIVAEKGGIPLPFSFKVPVVGSKTYGNGDVKGIIVRPGENSINIDDTCVVKFQLFGSEAEVTGVI